MGLFNDKMCKDWLRDLGVRQPPLRYAFNNRAVVIIVDGATKQHEHTRFFVEVECRREDAITNLAKYWHILENIPQFGVTLVHVVFPEYPHRERDLPPLGYIGQKMMDDYGGRFDYQLRDFGNECLRLEAESDDQYVRHIRSFFERVVTERLQLWEANHGR